MSLTYGSVCSGIEAATLAWEPLGWKAEWFAEIEKFPSQVLAHRWPGVTNFGDMTQLPHYIRNGWITAPDILVGGTPCQAFSVAGMRKGLVDPRGQLSITFTEIANAIDSQRPDDPCVVVWENVPGVLSDKTNAFGCFLAALVGEGVPLEPPGGKWSNAGCVLGPQRTAAWRILDAQYFGVAQRRRRVFVVASARAGFDPSEVLFESDGLRRDIAPSREAREEIAAFTPSSINAYRAGIGALRANGGDLGGGSEGLICMPINTQVATRGGAMGRNTGFGLGSETDPAFTLQAGHHHGVFVMPVELELAPPLMAGGGPAASHGSRSGNCRDAHIVPTLCMATGQGSAEIGIGTTLNCNHEAPIVTTHTLRGEGFDASEDGTGRGTPLTVVAFAENSRAEIRLEGGDGSRVGALSTGGGKAGQGVPTGVTTLAIRGRGDTHQLETRTDGTANALLTPNGGRGGIGVGAVHYGLTVRRLMPIECERLQGQPDNHTLIPGAADGPRYKAIGNSKAVPVVRWIGRRLQKEMMKCKLLR